ncbi:MAG: GDSL-type esterase/lipase family protein [Sumerlaeia bacterium]
MFVLLGLLMAVWGPLAAQDLPTTRTLRVTAVVPPESGDVYIAGNLDSLRNWHPQGKLMHGEGTRREADLVVPGGTLVEFKFTLGTWEQEMLTADFNVPDNFRVLVQDDTEVSAYVHRFRDLSNEVPYPDPERWREDIDRFKAQDAQAMPAPGGVLALGSSSIVHWHDHIQEDLAPLTVLPRGFGGSMMNDAVHYFDEVVTPYKPRAILLYEGDNDIAHGVFPETILEKFQDFMALLEVRLPGTRVYVLAVKPSPSRAGFAEQVAEMNALFAEEAKRDYRVTFLDVAAPMLGADGAPRPELFVEDMLHMNRQGYELWRDVVRPVLLEGEGKFEKEVAASH